MSEILWSSEPTARKQHSCDCCGRRIQPGEKYLRVRGVSEGDPYTWKECRHCRAFVQLYATEFAFDPHEGWTTGDIREWEPETPEAIEHKRQWAGIWRTGDGELYSEPRTVETTK